MTVKIYLKEFLPKKYFRLFTYLNIHIKHFYKIITKIYLYECTPCCLTYCWYNFVLYHICIKTCFHKYFQAYFDFNFLTLITKNNPYTYCKLGLNYVLVTL